MRGVEGEIREALDRVVRDVTATTQLRPKGRLSSEPDGSWLVVVDWREDGTTGWSDGEWPAAATEELATTIADWVQHEVERSLQLPWPQCPRHRHQLQPSREPPGRWSCPFDSDLGIEIGQLQQDLLGRWWVV